MKAVRDMIRKNPAVADLIKRFKLIPLRKYEKLSERSKNGQQRNPGTG